MSALFGSSENLIDITLYYKVINHGSYQQVKILEDDDAKKRISKEENIEILNTQWLPQTWGLNHDLMKQSYTYNPASGASEFDPIKFQENLLINSLEKWDAKDDEGNELPCNSENIYKLVTNVARELMDKYRAIVEGGEEEVKK